MSALLALEKGQWYSDDNREGDAKIVHEAPVTSQFLLVAKLGQDALVHLLDRIGSSAGPRHSPLDGGL